MKSFAALLALLAFLVAAVYSQAPTPPNPTAWAFLNSDPRYSRFTDQINRTAPVMIEYLNSASTQFVLFAPQNSAYDALSNNPVSNIIGKPEYGPANNLIVQYHVSTNSSFTYNGVPSGQNETIASLLVPVNITAFKANDGSLFANQARVVSPDQKVSNGVIHGINRVINPLFTVGINTDNVTWGDLLRLVYVPNLGQPILPPPSGGQ